MDIGVKVIYRQKGTCRMNWLNFFKVFLRNLLLFTVLSTLGLGGIGYLLAGKEGFLNLATWGFALGLLGSFSSGFAMLMSANFWSGYSTRYGQDWFKKQSEGEDNKKDY